MIIRHLVIFIKNTSIRFIKFMSCKNAERGVSSWALLLIYGNFNAKRNKIRYKYSPKNENGLTQLIRLGKSIRHIRVKKEEGLYCLCEINDT